MVGTLAPNLGVGAAARFYYVSQAGQATYSGADASPQALTLAYTPGYVEVSIDGVWQTPDEYTATNGSSIVFPVGLAAGRKVYVYCLSSFSVAGAVSFLSTQQLSAAQKSLARTNIGVVMLHGGRLTLASGTPIMSTTQSAKTTLFWTPYLTDQGPIFDGSNMVMTPSGELSALTTDTTKSPAAIGVNKVNDWFRWNDNGTIRLSHGPDWTNDTTRFDALVLVNGVWLNNVAITNGPAAQRGTYVGTTRSNASGQLDWVFAGSATPGLLYLWNLYNPVFVTATEQEVGSWTYSGSAIRTHQGGATARISFVSGLPNHGIVASNSILTRAPAVGGSFGDIGIGFDTTTGAAALARGGGLAAASLDAQPTATVGLAPQTGVHFIAGVESADGTNATTFFGGVRHTLTFQSMM